MPIEIREVIIKGTITEGAGSGAASVSQDSSNKAGDDLIKSCVEKVLEILKEKRER